MRAAVLKEPYRIVIEELAEPSPDRDQVVIEVAHCGICGSDIRYFRGENPWALHTLGRNAPNPLFRKRPFGPLVRRSHRPQ